MAMPNDSRPKVRVATLRNPSTESALQGRKQDRMQRFAVVALGCLWLLAFATGCSRKTKNCSAYDGVQFEAPVEAQN